MLHLQKIPIQPKRAVSLSPLFHNWEVGFPDMMNQSDNWTTA